METLELLGVALGLAGLAGINLYLTVFVTGLAINQHWITLAPQYHALGILGHPVIIILAGALYFLEFFADKVPWVDSLWDSVHTVIRPIGAAMISIRVLGDVDPVFDVIVAMLAGGTALMTHSVKATTRLVANSSPEPFSNIVLSVGEDLGVLGGLALIAYNPVLALGVLVLILAATIYFLPKLFRLLKVHLWLIWRKLRAPASGDAQDQPLPADLPADIDIMFSHLTVLEEKPVWAVPCVSGGGRRIPAHVFGYLIASQEEPRKVHFVGRRGWSQVAQSIDLEGCKVTREPRFVSENLVIYNRERKGSKYVFIFDRTDAGRVRRVAAFLEEQLRQAPVISEKVAALEPAGV